MYNVHHHTGGLEKSSQRGKPRGKVHHHTGGLENAKAKSKALAKASALDHYKKKSELNNGN